MIEVVNKTKSNEYIKEVEDIINKGLNKMGVIDAYVSVVIVSNEEIHEINKIYRGIDKVTDVISFAFEDAPNVSPGGIRVLGEIYLSIEKAKEQAKEYNHSIDREVKYLTVHGLLHLLGYDHIKKEEKRIMRGFEESILNE